MSTPQHMTSQKLSLEEIQKRNKSRIEKINTWQAFKYVKPLTCQKDGCGAVLVAKELKLKVILQCPKCRSIQAYIPKSVLQSNLTIFDE